MRQNEMINPICVKIAVVIPCYRVRDKVIDVISGVGSEVSKIYVVDDCCPEETGDFVQTNCTDQRVVSLKTDTNQGVGGAVMTGYAAAIRDGMDIIVKIDGDGQMDPRFLGVFVEPIISGEADYTKGNRFYDLQEIRQMPKIRLFGNAILSFMSKLSTGYWNLFDPTNGYTAIHSCVAQRLPYEKISRRYFFETDMLFRLNTLKAVVVDIPMHAKYGDEVSNLKISKIAGEFLWKHFRNFTKRIFYNYYLRDMSLASIELPLGAVLFFGGCAYGLYEWHSSANEGLFSSAGTVMLSALPILMGMQLILAFLAYDIAAVPRRTLFRRMGIKASEISKVNNEVSS